MTLERYPTLGRVLDDYIRRLQDLFAEEPRASWLRRAAEKAATTQGHRLNAYFQEWDSIAGLLDEESAQELSRRFLRTLPVEACEWRVDYDDAFLEVVSELLGYGWLKRDKQCGQVGFLQEGKSRQPDLAGDESTVVECKHFRTSDRDREYFAHHQGEARFVGAEGPDKLKGKILSTFKNDVLPKLTSYRWPDFERYMFADISPDAELWGPIEGQFPGTLENIVRAVGQVTAAENVRLVAIRFHSFRQPLTPNEFRVPEESLA